MTESLLKKNLPYQNKIICPFHQGQLVQVVCLDNICHEKLQCSLCLNYQNGFQSHNFIKLNEFYNSLEIYQSLDYNSLIQFKEQIKSTVEGNNPLCKNDKYESQSTKLRLQYEDQYIEQLGSQVDKYQHNKKLKNIYNFLNRFLQYITQKISSLKIEVVSLFKNMNEKVFSKETLQDKEVKDKACRIVMNALKGSDFMTANRSISHMHKGVYEVNFAKDKSLKLFSLLSDQIQQFLFNSQTLIEIEMSQFHNLVQNFQKKNNLSTINMFRRPSVQNAKSKFLSRIQNNSSKFSSQKLNTDQDEPQQNDSFIKLLQQQLYKQDNNNNSETNTFTEQIQNFNKNLKVNYENSVKNHFETNYYSLSSSNNQKRDNTNKILSFIEIQNQKSTSQIPSSLNSLLYSPRMRFEKQQQQPKNQISSKSNQSEDQNKLRQKSYTLHSSQKNLQAAYNKKPNLLQKYILNVIKSDKKNEIPELVFESQFEDLIQDIFVFQNQNMLLSFKSGKISLLEKQLKNEQISFKIVLTEQAHTVMGFFKSFSEQIPLFVSIGANQKLKTQLKIWQQTGDQQLVQVFQIQDLHHKTIKILEFYKEENEQIDSETTASNIFFLTIGEDNFIRNWKFRYDSTDHNNNDVEKLSQLEIPTKYIQRIVLQKNSQKFYFNNQNYMIQALINEQNELQLIQSTQVPLEEADEIVQFQIAKQSNQQFIFVVSKLGSIFQYTDNLKQLVNTQHFLKKHFKIKQQANHIIAGYRNINILQTFQFKDSRNFLILLNNKETPCLIFYDPFQEIIIKERKNHKSNIDLLICYDQYQFLTIEQSNLLRIWKD